MKTAIIGLPMVGKTSLFTILTGVHQESRIGSTSVRAGVARVPDARLDALINTRTVSGPRYNPATTAEIDTEEVL